MLRWIFAVALLAVAAPAFAQTVRPCSNSVVYDASTNGSTELVALSAGRKVYVCSLALWAGASATNVGLVYGTGSACATGETALTPMFRLAANTGLVIPAATWNGLQAPAGKALCLKTSAGNAVQGLVTYLQPPN
jgi:hypothetical protein